MFSLAVEGLVAKGSVALEGKMNVLDGVETAGGISKGVSVRLFVRSGLERSTRAALGVAFHLEEGK